MRVKQMMKQAIGCLLMLVLSAFPFLTAPAMAGYITHDRPSQILSNPEPKPGDFFSGSDRYDLSIEGSVAIDGDRIAIGSPMKTVDPNGKPGAVYVFDKSNKKVISISNPSPLSGERFGASVALDGDALVIGAPLNTVPGVGGEMGEAYLYNASTGERLQTFIAPDRAAVDRFGYDVAIDGDYVLIGAPYKTIPGVGGQIGKAYLYNASTGELLQTFSTPNPTGVDHFGASVAIDGDYVLIAAPFKTIPGVGGYIGEVYLFKVSTGERLRTFSNPSLAAADFFGASVAIDGDNVVISAPYKDIPGVAGDAGQAYLFKASTGERLQTFDIPNPRPADTFGLSVDIDGNFVLVGAIGKDVYGADAGAAYLFDASTGELKDIFYPPSAQVSEYFGYGVAIDGDSVLVGSVLKNAGAIGNAGEAYLYSVKASGIDQGSVKPSEIDQACDDGYVQNPANNHCYSLTAPMSWVEAQLQAETAGGNLVTINDQAEQDWLIDTFGDQIISDMPPSFWIGFTNKDYGDISGKGTRELVQTYKWVSDESSGFTSWNTLWSEPNNYQNSDERYADLCVKEGLVCPQVGVWNDRGSNWPILKGIIERS